MEGAAEFDRGSENRAAEAQISLYGLPDFSEETLFD